MSQRPLSLIGRGLQKPDDNVGRFFSHFVVWTDLPLESLSKFQMVGRINQWAPLGDSLTSAPPLRFEIIFRIKVTAGRTLAAPVAGFWHLAPNLPIKNASRLMEAVSATPLCTCVGFQCPPCNRINIATATVVGPTVR